MKLQQLSVFLENKPGRLSAPSRILADAGLNITTMALADTQQFGILRLIVRDWAQAKAALERAGCVVHVSDVVAVEVDNQPGGLARVLQSIEAAQLNVEYTYACICGGGGRSVLIFRFDAPDRAVAELQRHGLKIVGGDELFSRANGGCPA